MTPTANQLDLSPLSPACRREIRDFYHFLLERRGRRPKTGQEKVIKGKFTDLCGQLSWQGDAVMAQRNIRDEW